MRIETAIWLRAGNHGHQHSMTVFAENELKSQFFPHKDKSLTLMKILYFDVADTTN
jgi:hypothetical protein